MKTLWLAIHLPYLPLEARAIPSPPSAIVERGRVVLADDAAREAGVVCGAGIAVARMLAPEITLLARERSLETAALQTLACCCGSFTPHVSLTDDGLLLEIGRCLRLFGGVEKIADALATAVRELGYRAQLAVAPTAQAAQWLAQCGSDALCLENGEMRRHLDTLPLDVLPLAVATKLRAFGAATLGDVRRLPSAALARRVGVEVRQLIARAFGEVADPRADFVFPERFSLPLPLPASVDSAGALLFAANRLTSALAGWLAARRSGVREFTLHLVHRNAETALRLQLADLSADGKRFERVLRERLERTTLAAAVDALRLDADAPAALVARNLALFDNAQDGREAVGRLCERLCARLGQAQVYRLGEHADYRPEYATRRIAPFAAAPAGIDGAPARPLWLVDPPQAIAEVDGRPFRRGPLKLLAGPERIESGWWDGAEIRSEEGARTNAAIGDVRRDYFIALSAEGCWLWIYRECRLPGGWFVHGVFA